MTKEEKDNLLQRKVELHNKLVPVYRELKALRTLIEPIEDKFNQLKMEYRDVDRQLALIDGRTKKLKTITSKKKPKPIKKFTPDEVARIAKELGIKLV